MKGGDGVKGGACIVVPRERVYVFIFPKKVFTPSHGGGLSLNFSNFECEGLRFEAFTRRKHAVNGRNGTPSHRKWAGNQQISDKKGCFAVNACFSKPSHLKLLEISRKKPVCEGMNVFLRVKKAYIEESFWGADRRERDGHADAFPARSQLVRNGFRMASFIPSTLSLK